MARAGSKHKILWCEPTIGAVRVPVYLVNPRCKLGRKHLSDSIGFFNSDPLEIYIDWRSAHDLAENTLVHEMGHAALFLAGTPLLTSRAHTEEEEELVVNALSSVLYAALKHNDMLVIPARPATPWDTKDTHEDA